ncbi:MAG: glucose-6-phosphate isomerase [Bacteroidales bacterium]
MKRISLIIDKVFGAVSKEQVYARAAQAQACMEMLHNGSGEGSDFLGWLHLPYSLTEAELAGIEHAANVLRSKCEVVVIIGIGGSYLGARAVLEALNNTFDSLRNDRTNPLILYAGHHIGEDYLYELCEVLKGKRFGLINISKSGTTTEPALAFRILRRQLEDTAGKEEAKRRIVAVTDARRGALHTLAGREGYQTFVIPDNVGGRFSVFTPAGLLPIAAGGVAIRNLVAGAAAMEKAAGLDVPFAENLPAVYAAVRNELYKSGKKIEILAGFHPKLHYVAEWWKQLYGESEGKDTKGLFPASVDLTTDLHSMGQWIQQGERSIFETVLSVESPDRTVVVPADEADLDGLNFLAGKRVDEINKMAELGTQLAHADGGVPNIKIVLPELSAYYIGQLLYFFEIGCGISGYMLGVNPFDQPGVEAYKRNMFALLNKPGFEKEAEAIKARL